MIDGLLAKSFWPIPGVFVVMGVLFVICWEVRCFLRQPSRLLRGRPRIADEEYVRRFYGDGSVPAELAIRIRRDLSFECEVDHELILPTDKLFEDLVVTGVPEIFSRPDVDAIQAYLGDWATRYSISVDDPVWSRVKTVDDCIRFFATLENPEARDDRGESDDRCRGGG